MKKAPKGAEARLEDLDVREVSVVDRPANLKPFLIVKRLGGDTEIVLEDDDMRTAISKKEAARHGYIPDPDFVSKDADEPGDDVLDLFDLAVDDDDVDEDDGDLEIIEKKKTSEVSKAIKGWLAALSAVSAQLSKAVEKDGKAEVADAVVSKLNAVASSISSFAGGEDADKVAKAAAAATAKTVKKALEQLMAIANKLKSADGAADAPGAVMSKLAAVGKMLTQAEGGKGKDTDADADAEGGGKADDKGDEDKKKTAKRLQVFVSKRDDGEPEIIIKAGAKMKKARLNQFKRVVETLQSLLTELEGGEGGDSKSDKKATKKAVEDVVGSLEERIVKGLEGFKEAMESKIGEVAKRIDDLDGARPLGEGDADVDDKDEVKKNKGGLWSNLLR